MTFTVYIKGQAISDGVSVFPFSFGQLLDERLDEAYLHITKSATPYYTPTTEVRIDLREGNTVVKQFYFVVAKDEAYELPVGSGQYKHSIYLIERTKLLEGIYCQSITFTNSIGNNYTKNAATIAPLDNSNSYTGNEFIQVSPIPSEYRNEHLKTPVVLGSVIQIPSAATVGREIAEMWAENNGGVEISATVEEEYSNFSSSLQVSMNGETEDYAYNVSPSFVATPSMSYVYNIVARIVFESAGVSTTQMVFFSCTFSAFAVTNTLPLKPNTVTDCINRVLDLAEPRFGNDPPRYRLNAAQAEEFDQIPAADFTMTQCTLREALKVIGGYIHGEPRLNENDEIYFEMYGNTTPSEEVGDGTTYVYKGYTHDIGQYCTQVDTTASNIVNALNYAQGVISTPSAKNVTAYRTESVYVRVNEENGFIPTDFPIQDIAKVECGVYGSNGLFEIGMQDITPYIFTGTAYSALSMFGGGYPRAKSFALYYDIGQKNIKGLFFKEESVKSTFYQYLEYFAIVNILAAAVGWSPSAVRDKIGAMYENLVFRISYIPIYNTRFSHGKQGVEEGTEYTQIYNQSENLIEARYYGENVKGAAYRLGNVEQSRTYIFDTFSKIPKVGQLIDTGTEGTPDEYAISAVNTEVFPTYYKTTVALTKDFNRISEYVSISQNKRVYEVSESEAYLRNILLKEYAIVGKNGNYQESIFRDALGIASAFSPSITDIDDNQASPISSVIAWGGTYANPTDADISAGIKPPLPMVSLPVVSSAFGNAMVFSWSYKDNYSAGARLMKAEQGGVSGLWQQDVEYCDAYGRMYYYNFALLGKNEETDFGKDFSLSAPCVETQDAFPYRTKSKVKTQAPYRIRKDSREILNFNLALEFKSNVKNLILGSALASASRLVSTATGAPAVIYRYDGANAPTFGKFEQQYRPESGAVSLVGVSLNGDATVEITLPEGTQNFSSWVITTPVVAGTPYQVQDEQGNVTTITPKTGGDILLACNNPAALFRELGNSNTIYINLSKSQKEEPQ